MDPVKESFFNSQTSVYDLPIRKRYTMAQDNFSRLQSNQESAPFDLSASRSNSFSSSDISGSCSVEAEPASPVGGYQPFAPAGYHTCSTGGGGYQSYSPASYQPYSPASSGYQQPYSPAALSDSSSGSSGGGGGHPPHTSDQTAGYRSQNEFSSAAPSSDGGYWPPSSSFASSIFGQTNHHTQSTEAAGSGGCSGRALDYTKPRSTVRAGVIRHSSNPRLCLAYYYLRK